MGFVELDLHTGRRRSVANTLTAEQAKFERLALLTKTLYDEVQKTVLRGSEWFFFVCLCFVLFVWRSGA